MIAGDPATPRDVGRSFAATVREEHAACRLWTRPHRDYIELWLLTAPTDAETVRRLHGAGIRVQEDFPGLDVRLHVLNPRLYPDADPATLIPQGAEEIPLRPE